MSLNATYFWDMFELDWSVTGSYYYQGEQWMTPFNDPLYDKVGSWDRWDARMTAADKEKVWEVTAFIKNITDDREIITRRPPQYGHPECADRPDRPADLRAAPGIQLLTVHSVPDCGKSA